MPEDAPTSDPDRPTGSEAQSTPGGRRLARVLIPGTIVGVILGIFAVLLVITQCGSSADDVSQGMDPRSTEATAVLDAGFALRLPLLDWTQEPAQRIPAAGAVTSPVEVRWRHGDHRRLDRLPGSDHDRPRA